MDKSPYTKNSTPTQKTTTKRSVTPDKILKNYVTKVQAKSKSPIQKSKNT